MTAMTLSSVRQTRRERTAPTPAEGSVERMVIGMDVAFIENAEHDVDRHERGQDQKRLVGQGGLKGLGRALETARGCWPACPSR